MTAQLTPPPTPARRMYTAVQAAPVPVNRQSSTQPSTYNAPRMSRGLPIDALLSSRPEPARETHAIEKFHEHGRVYYRFRQDMYMFPADDTEHERLDILHDLIYGTAMAGQLHIADFGRNPPRRVLDVGFGSGFWMIEAGKRYPDCQIIGFDLDNPLGVAQDRNCQFRSPVDFTAPTWAIEDASVDLVHMAQLCGCVPRWEDLYAKAFRSLRPNTGQIEHIEFDWTPRTNEPQMPPQATDLVNWWYWMLLASDKAGKSLRFREDTEDLLENAGFVDVSHKRVRVPLFNAGTKDKRERKLAHAYQTAMGHQDSQSFTGFTMALFTRYHGMPPEQAAQICAQALAVVQAQPLPLYITLHVYTARRPQS